MIVRTRWVLYVALALLALEAARLADTSLAEIYHKYRPMLDSLNASASNLIEQIQSADSSSPIVNSRGAEYQSPIKRIVELITQHAPVIVMDEQHHASNGRQPQFEEDALPSQLLNHHRIYESNQHQHHHRPVMHHEQPHAGAGSTRHHWALVDTSQLHQHQPASFLATESPLNQPMSIQSSVPYEQYYLTPGGQSQQTQQQQHGLTTMDTVHVGQQHFGMPAGHQLSFVPSSGLFPAAPHFATIPMEPQQDQSTLAFQHPIHQMQLQQQQKHQPEERAQPILLSSFVPSAAPRAQDLPSSIQQIQKAQEAPKSESTASGNADDDDQLKQQEKSNEPMKSNDIEDEPSSGVRNKQQQEDGDDDDDESPTRNSGSINYEDKYDSDKEDQKQDPGARAESSSNVVNGLINVGLNDDCLQCICRASSGCDHLLRCITRGSEEKYCGPFQLTEEYWQKAGSPGDASNNFLAFEDCANEADCAVETVTNYMKKHHRDCDGDDNITCMDYARLHKLQPDECDNTEKLMNNFDAYWPKFQRCAEGYNKSRNGDDEEI